MCISVAPVEFGKTVTGLHQASDGSHVVFYQNVVGSGTRSRSRGSANRPDLLSASVSSMMPDNWSVEDEEAALPDNWKIAEKPRGNALVIPLITSDFGSVELLRATAETPDLLKDVRRSLMPPQRRSRGPATLGGTRGGDVVIEQFDIYTIVRAENASAIPEAVEAVDARQRPPLNQELFDALERWYGCPFAVACFNNADQGESKPIAFKYSPKYSKVFMIYTLDGHDGSVPDLNATVDLDHTVFASTHDGEKGNKVRYSDDIPEELAPYVPSHVVGRSLPSGTRLVNGDILVPVESVKAGKFEAYRVLPPNAPSRKPTTLEEALA